ncbi:MAG: NADPH:quinone reductase [Nitrospinaceae bacterium]|jgi:NADPH:quinone reductase|nr:NADPH:quinone reductase [Nitrospinaceae bacterium]MBT3433502.1 NADPH:quinone reductase [Nitrospinaceae bacterium]MBT4095713.1 NADPH:quinone reductase [Nitrospinaceae bacterium]MBT4429902.1 NADPH:quinone reductase [Nitrospinaceae bacterium]MBT5367195.1 NADPH:quinone reductase [Nitrospinaceae bacterium]
MKAMRVHKFGLETPMQLDEIEDARPGAGEVLIKTHAIGAHPVDVTIRGGMHPFQKFVTPPYMPGPEAAGEVVELGVGVEGFEVGQRVCGRAMGGAYAELVRLGAPWTLNLPDAYSWAEGAGLAVQFITAWNSVVINGRASAGEVVLVQGGAGGVGMASIQLARAVGCRVIATASSPEKLKIAKEMGADEVINYREENFAERCLELTGGRGVDVIIEMIAEENLDKDVDAICPLGRIVVVGTSKGLDPDAAFGVQRALMKDAQILCVSMVNLPPRLPKLMRHLTPMVEAGNFDVRIFREMPLIEANAAHALLWGGEVTGKLVLVP